MSPGTDIHSGTAWDAKPRLGPGLHLNSRAAVLAGLGAGAVFLVLELLTAFIFGAGTPFGPAHVTLQGFVGAEAVPGSFNPGLVLAALFVHFCLSVLVILPLAMLIHPWQKRYLILAVGFVYGCALYGINSNIYSLFLPLLATARDVFMLVDYVLFSMMAVWLYATLRDRFEPEAAVASRGGAPN